MISLKRLIMNPKSPDRALQQAYSEAESAHARIAHVNRLSRDINDIKFYELDLDGSNGALLKISSKKGIVDVVNMDSGANELYISLQNPEITQDREKFYVQLSAYASGNAVPVVVGIGFIPDTFNLRIFDVAGTNGQWGALYFYYEIVKID